MANSEIPSPHVFTAERYLQHIEDKTAQATKNVTWSPPYPDNGLSVLEPVPVLVRTKQTIWRSRLPEITFTHNESGEVIKGSGVQHVGFRITTPFENKNYYPLPEYQISIALGATALEGPLTGVSRFRIGKKPKIDEDWQEKWASDLPPIGAYHFDYYGAERYYDEGRKEDDPVLEQITLTGRGPAERLYGRTEMILEGSELPLDHLKDVANRIHAVDSSRSLMSP